MEATMKNESSGCLGALIVIVVLIVWSTLLGPAMSQIQKASVQVAPQVASQSHAVINHGDDALQVRKCLEQQGPDQIWKARNDSTFYLLCQLPDGRWGIRAIIKSGKTWIEKTAFVKGEGTWRELLDYLGRFATKYTGPLK